MKTIDLIERVLTRITSPRAVEEGEFDYPIEAQIPTALETLARQAAAEDGTLLTKAFTVTAAAGIADISGMSNAAEPILLDFIDRANVRITSYSFPLRAAPDRAWLSLDPSKVPSYAIENDTLYVRGLDGRLGTFAGVVTISAPYVPSLANVPRSLEGKLVEIVVAMVMKIMKPPRRLATEKEAVAKA